MDSVLGFGPGVSGSIPSSGKNFVVRDNLVGFGCRLGMRVQAESFLMMHEGRSEGERL